LMFYQTLLDRLATLFAKNTMLEDNVRSFSRGFKPLFCDAPRFSLPLHVELN